MLVVQWNLLLQLLCHLLLFHQKGHMWVWNFKKGFPPRCGYIDAPFKELEMVLTIGKGVYKLFFGHALPENF